MVEVEEEVNFSLKTLFLFFYKSDEDSFNLAWILDQEMFLTLESCVSFQFNHSSAHERLTFLLDNGFQCLSTHCRWIIKALFHGCDLTKFRILKSTFFAIIF